MAGAMKSALDRIIVKSNARMMQIINWYIANQDYLESQPFVMPFKQGLVCMEEEDIDFSFETYSESDILIKIYPGQKEFVMVAFHYDPIQDIIRDKDWSAAAKTTAPANLQKLKIIEKMDKTCKKEAFKLRVLMLYTAYYRNEVVIDKKAQTRLSKSSRRSLRKKNISDIPLVRNTYILSPEAESLKKPVDPDKKRHYEKPDHEVKVRGYYRKNGKWVAPYVRYKDKGSNGPKTYKA